MNNFAFRRSCGCLVLRGTAAFTWWPIWSRGSFARIVRMTTTWFTTQTWRSTPTELWSPGWLIIYLSVGVANCVRYTPVLDLFAKKTCLVFPVNGLPFPHKHDWFFLFIRWNSDSASESSLDLFAFDAVVCWLSAIALLRANCNSSRRSQLIKVVWSLVHAADCVCVVRSQVVCLVCVFLWNARGKRAQRVGNAVKCLGMLAARHSSAASCIYSTHTLPPWVLCVLARFETSTVRQWHG